MKKVLIVDDSLFIRAMIKGVLVQNGYEVIEEACDGDDAISKYKEFQPDIVTMDITMPGTNGIVASKEILKLNPDAKIIVISALGHQDYILDLLKSGVKDYMFKPVNPQLLIQTVKTIEAKFWNT